jgi:hypothetical protein
MPSVRLLLSLAALLLLIRPAAAQPASTGDGRLAISLAGGISKSADHHSYYGVVGLVIALDLLAMPRVVFAKPAGFALPPDEPAPDTTQNDEAAAEASTAADSEASFEEVDLRRWTSSAFVRRLVAAALRVAGSSRSEERLASLASRARTSAALPEVRLRAARKADESLRLSPTDSDPYRYTQSGGHDIVLEARLTWRLDRLVFADAELRVEALRMQRAERHAALVKRVLDKLFAWQRAMLKFMDQATSPEQRSRALLDQLQAEAELDVLTGGWFAEQLGNAAPPP